MSIDRGDRVISQMLRSLCCANRTAKVADVAGVAAAGAKHDDIASKRAIVMCSDVVLHRGLVGKFVAILEDKSLVASELRLAKPSHDAISKSKLLPRSPPEILVISEWSGDDVAHKISESTKQFRQQYALAAKDLCFCIETSLAEHKLWFANEIAEIAAENPEDQDSASSFSTGNGPGMENLSETSTNQQENSENSGNIGESGEKQEEIIRAPLDKDQVSSIGPNPSINSEIPEVVEIMSNTVDAILPNNENQEAK